MKIAFIGQKGIPAAGGGVEAHVDRLSRELARRGHHVRVYVRDWYTSKRLRGYDGVEIVHLPTIKTKHLDASVHSLLCSLHVLFWRPDIVHYHALGPSAFCPIPRLFGIRVVSTIHRLDWATEKWRKPAKLALRLAERISVKVPNRTIVVSEALREYVKEKYGKDVSFIPNGLDRPHFRPTLASQAARGITPGKYILYMGRLVPEKRPDWLIESFRRLKATPLLNDGLKLVIAGGSSETNHYVESLREMGRRNPDVVFTGHVLGRAKEELLSNALLFVLPSYLEGFPIALLEAQNYGLCIVASDIPAHREMVRDGKDGLLFRHDDPDDLTAKIRFLVEHPEEAEKLGREAGRVAAKKYSWRDVADRTAPVYEEARKPRAPR